MIKKRYDLPERIENMKWVHQYIFDGMTILCVKKTLCFVYNMEMHEKNISENLIQIKTLDIMDSQGY